MRTITIFAAFARATAAVVKARNTSTTCETPRAFSRPLASAAPIKDMLAELDRTGESQISLTDPDSRAMAAHTHVAVGYNVQVAVEDPYRQFGS